MKPDKEGLGLGSGKMGGVRLQKIKVTTKLTTNNINT